ncbi:hypothetical protein ACQBAU_15075 [Propionibacteriaceae bacterium Y2011]
MTLAPEPRYGFRQRLTTVHTADRRDPAATRESDETEITGDWQIVFDGEDPLARTAATDLQDYLLVSMEVSVPIVPAARAARERPSVVVSAATAAPAGVDTAGLGEDDRSQLVVIEDRRILLCGRGSRGALRAAHHLEELCNLRGGPYLSPGRYTRTPRFRRMSHSGYGLDDFPDEHLAQLAHAGMDAIVVFVSAPDRTPDGQIRRNPASGSRGRHQRLAELAERAERHGLDTYLYAYFRGDRAPHPDAPGAEEFYARTYGACFAACPQAKGIVLVGESIEFPSTDPHTTGRLRLDPVPGNLPNSKPSPGWWPCTDYPQWVARVRDACRAENPDAEIVFWTYNWGYAPKEDRLELIKNLPDDVTVQVTFEMFQSFTHHGVTNTCADYTASHVGPGDYFRSEATAVHERGMALASMTNTGGLTWDIGVIGYQPIPYQWSRRHAAVNRARDDWGLGLLMENHHYGWMPSFISELTNATFHDPAPDPELYLSTLARRDFGAGAEEALAAWRAWSQASTHYVPTAADQYGPFRIGPAYPLTLFAVPKLMVDDEAMFGDMIVKIPYAPDTAGRQLKTAPAIRVPAEILSLQEMAELWSTGLEHLDRAVTLAPAHRRAEVDRQRNLGGFITCCIATTINTKRWWLAKSRLLVEADPARARELLAELTAIGGEEYTNAESAIGYVEADSRLGWEPTMGYLGDAAHIRWKLAHLSHALEQEIPRYEQSLP